MVLHGIGASAGVALGHAYCYTPQETRAAYRTFPAGQEQPQLSRWEQARQQVADALEQDIRHAKDTQQAEIFAAHRELLEDEEILDEIKERISGRREDPAWAVQESFAGFCGLLEAAGDALFAQRASDLKDLCRRLMFALSGCAETELSRLPEGTILAARDLLPSDTAAIDIGRVCGLVTEQGGATAHVAIIARSLGIPAVVGAAGLLEQLHTGDELILDGETGEVFLYPTSETAARMEKRRGEFLSRAVRIAEFAGRPACLADGLPLQVGANLGADSIRQSIGEFDFVGLLRSEFLYMDADHLPTEQEQFEFYRAALQRAGGKPVTLRTLDIGGDKTLPYLPLPREDNPFLGNRAIRLCLAHPDLFRCQLRAALRAAVYGPLQIMFPMVGSLEDFRRAKQAVEEAKASLIADGLPFGEKVPLGIMVEIPSAAILADQFAVEADFASIGTNDLCQYLCAADRLNPAVSSNYQPLSPAMLRLLQWTIRSFTEAGKPISMCGEMAGDSRMAQLLVGLGLRKFSMSPAAVLPFKQTVSHFTLPQAITLSQTALTCSTQEEVMQLLDGYAVPQDE